MKYRFITVSCLRKCWFLLCIFFADYDKVYSTSKHIALLTTLGAQRAVNIYNGISVIHDIKNFYDLAVLIRHDISEIPTVGYKMLSHLSILFVQLSICDHSIFYMYLLAFLYYSAPVLLRGHHCYMLHYNVGRFLSL